MNRNKHLKNLAAFGLMAAGISAIVLIYQTLDAKTTVDVIRYGALLISNGLCALGSVLLLDHNVMVPESKIAALGEK